jgi:hypothetical protein
MDCFSLSLECLERYTDLSRFSHIHIIANALDPAHLSLAESFAERHENTRISIAEPRGMPPVMRVQETILRQHMDALVVKLDEDVFVTPGWLDGLLAVHAKHRDRGCFLVSSLVPNNAVGRLLLRSVFDWKFPEYAASEALQAGPISRNFLYPVWIWEKLLHGRIRYDAPDVVNLMRTRRIRRSLSINCILFDPRMTEAILPFGDQPDEYHVNVAMNSLADTYFGLVTPLSVAHHYSFGPQQEALDKALSLEAIRDCLLHSRFTLANDDRGQSA